MKTIRLLSVLLFTMLMLTTDICLADLTVDQIINKQGKILLINTDLSAKIKVVQQKVNQGTKQVELFYYRRDEDDSFLMIATSPAKEKGNGYLRVGDNQWLYRRNTRTFQHINRDENISGTDIKAGQFEKKKIAELYEPAKDKNGNEILEKDVISNIPVYRYELVAKVKDVAFPKQEWFINQETLLPMKVNNFSLSGTLMSTDYYLKFTQINDKYFPMKVMNVDKFEKGNKAIMEVSGISLKPLDNTIFTKAYLENISK